MTPSISVDSIPTTTNSFNLSALKAEAVKLLPKSLTPIHPLASLQPHELTIVSRVTKEYNSNKVLSFRRVLLREPPKALVVPYLQAELAGKSLPRSPTRYGQALFYFEGETAFIETIVDIENQKVVSQRILEGMHGPGDDDEVIECAKKSILSPLVQKEIERLQLPEGCQIVSEPWPYGTDETEVNVRLFQVWFYLNLKENKDHKGANFYAHPLDFSAVVQASNMEVIRIDRMPTTTELLADTSPDTRYQVNANSEYAPDLIEGGLRTDLKPLHITQPEGVSFTFEDDGETVNWQKWRFRVSFDVREGVVLRNVCYDGRPLFYRMALSEMTVPYGDPRAPLHRKSAYDLGECGAGQTANSLQLGCDCLGVIHYMDGLSVSGAGEPVIIPSAICVHEQDAGLAWKHTNIQTGRADVARSRELVFQLIVTVGNYEYALYWIFDTAATIHYEIRATGIMSVTPIELGVDVTSLKFGTVVAEAVFAPHHQHIFNLRLDPAIDGYEDGVVTYTDTLPMPRNNETNPYGVGFEVHTTEIKEESAFNLNWETNRVVMMTNPNSLNKFSKKPVAYKIVAPPTQLGLADETSMHNRRGEFVNNHIHVTKYDDQEMYGAGEFNWQSTGGQGGCRTWASRKQQLEAGSSVVWFTLGFTHATKSEDWPVMPSETFRMHIKPAGFFERNPALDIAPATQKANKSSYAKVNSNSSCCSSK